MKSERHFLHPATLFFLLAVVVVWVSWALSVYSVHAIHPLTQQEVPILNLLSAEGIRWIVRHALDNFLHYTPVAPSVVGMAAFGLLVQSGWCQACFHYARQTRQSQRALLHVGVVALLYGLLVGSATLWSGGILRSADATFRHSAFVDGWFLLTVLLVGLIGMTYGLSSGRFRTDQDLMNGMLRYARPLTEYLLTLFFAAQWMACLHWSQLDVYLAIRLGIYHPDMMQVLSRILACLLLIFPFLHSKSEKKVPGNCLFR